MWIKRNGKLVLKGYDDASIDMRYDNPYPFLATVGAWSQEFVWLEDAKYGAERFVADRDAFESNDPHDSMVAPEPTEAKKYLSERGLG
jgi:hypothetical protein